MLGKRIKKLRKEKNLTQVELSKIIGVTTSMVGMYETDARKPSYEVLLKIAEYFNVSTDYLLGKEDDYKINTIAAHHDGENFTEEELEEIEQFKEFIKNRKRK